MSVVELIRRVVDSELAQHRGTVLGVVTATFPHTAADDDNNYEVDVRLRHEGLQLRRVPVAVPHVGVAAPPNPGDLVLVQFVGGELNAPVVTGRLYHADARPPRHADGEILVEHRVGDQLNHLRFAADGSVLLQWDVSVSDGETTAKTAITIDGATGDVRVAVGDDVALTLTSTAITIDGDVTVNGKLVVAKDGHSTTIDGNTIGGA